jgi:uncharacterized radical SAM superfamily protein
VPLQLPEAVQLVASADDQVIVVELPAITELAASVSVGAAGTPDVVDVPLPPPPQAATRIVTRIRKTFRRPLCARIFLNSRLRLDSTARTLGIISIRLLTKSNI